MSTPITEHRGFLIVAVVDDDTGRTDYYDVHDFTWGDWTEEEPVASFIPTKKAAREFIAGELRWRKMRNRFR